MAVNRPSPSTALCENSDMPWIYSVTRKSFFRSCPMPNGKPSNFPGYSGKRGQWRDNYEKEGVSNLGPIPRGDYRIGQAYEHTKLGPVTMNLDPINHNALGRTVFRIHGNNKNIDASTGCIILDKAFRDVIADAVKNGDSLLTVIE